MGMKIRDKLFKRCGIRKYSTYKSRIYKSRDEKYRDDYNNIKFWEAYK